MQPQQLASKHVALHRVLALFHPHRKQLLMVLALILLSSIFGLAAPFLLRNIIDQALPAGDLHWLAWLTGALTTLACLATLAGLLQVQITTQVGQSIMHGLRIRVYAHLQLLSLGFFSTARNGEIQSRIANDIGGLQALVTYTAGELSRNLSVVLMTSLAMLALEWRLALFSFLVLPVALWISHRVGRIREAITYEQQERLADMASTVQESLSISGIILARTMGRSGDLTRRFTAKSEQVAALEVRSHTAGQWEWSIIGILLQTLPGLTLLLGGLLISQGSNEITIGTLTAIIALQEQLLWPLIEVLNSTVQIRSTRALFARIFDYLDRAPEVVEKADPVILNQETTSAAVQLRDVRFGYDKTLPPTLDGITFDVPAGSHTAIVGATGSGKTTLGYLLARLYDVDSGAILYEGVDLRELSFHSLSRLLGVVTQDPYLFNDTIAANLRFADPEATDADLAAAAKAAQLHTLISSLPQGYETIVGERGYRFSGGEKQRISLARTLLRGPRVLLLDEATSALDTITEQAIANALETVAKGCTRITIAHRLSAVRQADQIIVLSEGRIVERGRHEELLELKGFYTDLVLPGTKRPPSLPKLLK